MPTPPIGSRTAASILTGFPSIRNLTEYRDVADTFSDLRLWLRRVCTHDELSLAGRSLSIDQRRAVLTFLEHISQDPIRKKVAKELLSKLSEDAAWCDAPCKQNACGRSASVSGVPLVADPIRHKLVKQLLEENLAPPLKRDDKNDAKADAIVTQTFAVPHACHHIVVGKQGKQIAKLEASHCVTMRVPKPEEECDALAVSGAPLAVERCRKALEDLLCLPIGVDALHTMKLGIPAACYGAIVGEHGTILLRLMSECKVFINVPRPNQLGDVTVYGTFEGCHIAKTKIEAILKDSVLVLSSGRGESISMPLPPSFDLGTSQSINRCLFFPESASQRSHDGLSSLETLLKFLDSTRASCDVCVFTITDNRIARRLLDAHRYRDVRIRIITDRGQSDSLGSDIAELRAAGIEVRMNTSDYHMHHKFCILDDCVLVNGSFNWTLGACENNCENVMVTNDVNFVAPFHTQFEQLWHDYMPASGQDRMCKPTSCHLPRKK